MTIAANSRSAREGASSPTGDPWLRTPDPLVTSPTVKAAMLHELGSPDRHFIAAIRATLKGMGVVSGAPMAVAAAKRRA